MATTSKKMVQAHPGCLSPYQQDVNGYMLHLARKKVLYMLLRSVLPLMQGSAGTLDAVLEALLRGASTHIEAQTRKTCVQVNMPGSADQHVSFAQPPCQSISCSAVLHLLQKGKD